MATPDPHAGSMHVGEYTFTDDSGATVRVAVRLDLARVHEAVAVVAQKARRTVNRRATMAHGAFVVDVLYDSKPPPLR